MRNAYSSLGENKPNLDWLHMVCILSKDISPASWPIPPALLLTCLQTLRNPGPLIRSRRLLQSPPAATTRFGHNQKFRSVWLVQLAVTCQLSQIRITVFPLRNPQPLAFSSSIVADQGLFASTVQCGKPRAWQIITFHEPFVSRLVAFGR